MEKRVNSSPQSYLAEEKGRDDCMGMEDRKLSGRERHSSLCSQRTHRTMKNRCHEVEVLPKNMADGAESTAEYGHLRFHSLPTKIFH